MKSFSKVIDNFNKGNLDNSIINKNENQNNDLIQGKSYMKNKKNIISHLEKKHKITEGFENRETLWGKQELSRNTIDQLASKELQEMKVLEDRFKSILSKYSRTYKQYMENIVKFVNDGNSKYNGRNVKQKDGAIYYITNGGTARWYSNDAWNKKHKSCSNKQLLEIDSIQNSDLKIGNPMRVGEPCGYEMQNIKVGHSLGPLVNVASSSVGSKASQFNSYANNHYPASNAIDNNVNTFNHTLNTMGTWWEVVFPYKCQISSVTIKNRTDCCWDRLRNFFVIFYDENKNEVYRENIVQEKTDPNNYFMYGPWIGGQKPVLKVIQENGRVVYLIEDGRYTKMVKTNNDGTNPEAFYYVGKIPQYGSINLRNANGNYKLLNKTLTYQINGLDVIANSMRVQQNVADFLHMGNVEVMGREIYSSSDKGKVGYVDANSSLRVYPNNNTHNTSGTCPSFIQDIDDTTWNAFERGDDMSPTTLCGIGNVDPSLRRQVGELNNQLIQISEEIYEKINETRAKIGKVGNQNNIEETYFQEQLDRFKVLFNEMGKINKKSVTLDAMVEDSKSKHDVYNYRYVMWTIMAVLLGLITYKQLRR